MYTRDACSSRANKMGIVYKANLNFKTANCYIKPLVKENLAEYLYGNTCLVQDDSHER